MAILITGGTGFLGRHLTRHLIQAGENVVILDAVPNRQAVADIASKVKVLQGDVMEVTAMMDVIQRNTIEGIIHLAYYLGTGGIRNPLPSINVNCIGTTHIFEAARLSGIKRVVYMSFLNEQHSPLQSLTKTTRRLRQRATRPACMGRVNCSTNIRLTIIIMPMGWI